MTPAQMLRVHCTALGFLGIQLKSDVPEDKQASYARTLGRLIESYCLVTVPDALGLTNENIGDDADPAMLDGLIEKYKAESLGGGKAQLPFDRATLLKIYDRQMHRAQRRNDKNFYEFASDHEITTRIMNLLEVEIDGEMDE